MEYLTFNAGGQWDLRKASGDEPRSTDAVGNKPFKSFSSATATGQLHEDRGTKGQLHNFGGGNRPKVEGALSPKNWGKPSHNEDSVYADQNPGIAQ